MSDESRHHHRHPLHLFDLPIDILSLILSHILLTPAPISLCPCGGGGGITSTGPDSTLLARPLPPSTSPTTVFLVHPSVYAVACPLFYGANAFELDICGSHAGHVRKGLAPDWAEDVVVAGELGSSGRRMALVGEREALRRVRRLTLRVERLRGWVGDLVVPLVSDMIVHGSVTDLSIVIHPPSSSSSSSSSSRRVPNRPPPPPAASNTGSNPDTSIFTRPPLRNLLSLLADPYLHRARLHLVDAEGQHDAAPAWQRFLLPLRGGDEDTTAARTRTRTREVDWRAIVREVDPDGRAVPREWAEDGTVVRKNRM